MESDYEQEQLWALLGEEAEAGEPSAPPRVAGLSQQPSFGDRMARRLAGGVIPLFLAGLLPALFSAALNDWLGIFFALLMLVLLSWIISPLVRGSGFTSAWRLAVLFFPMGICVATFGLLPVPLLRGKVDDTAYFYQIALTTLLDRPGWAILLGVLIFVGLPAYFARRAFPWVRVQPASLGRSLVAWLVVLLPFVLYGLLWAASNPARSVVDWKARTALLIPAERTEGQDSWSELYEKYSLLTLDRDKKQIGDFEKLARAMVVQMERRLPSSLHQSEETAYAVERILKKSDLKLQKEERARLYYLLVYTRAFGRVPGRTEESDFNMFGEVLPQLTVTQDIDGWRARLKQLRSALPESSLQELDMNAWLHFFSPPASGPDVFAKLEDGPVRNRAYLEPERQLVKAGRPGARPFEFFGIQVDGSPTQLLERWQQEQRLEAWVRLRDQLAAKGPKVQRSEIFRLNQFHGAMLPLPMLEEFTSRAYLSGMEPLINTGLLILELRQQKEPHLTAEQAVHWSLEKVDGHWRLSVIDPSEGAGVWVIR